MEEKDMKEYMVKTMDSGRTCRRYFKTESGARRFFNACGGAVLYKYDYDTFCYEYVDAR